MCLRPASLPSTADHTPDRLNRMRVSFPHHARIGYHVRYPIASAEAQGGGAIMIRVDVETILMAGGPMPSVVVLRERQIGRASCRERV